MECFNIYILPFSTYFVICAKYLYMEIQSDIWFGNWCVLNFDYAVYNPLNVCCLYKCICG